MKSEVIKALQNYEEKKRNCRLDNIHIGMIKDLDYLGVKIITDIITEFFFFNVNVCLVLV
jgi:hypothetical protein